MLRLYGENAVRFKKMFKYIPDKVFQSIMLVLEARDDKVFIKFSDLDINRSLVVNIETELEGFDASEFEDDYFRLPISKNVENVIKNFDEFVIENNTIKGISEKKEVQLSMLIVDDDEIYAFPNNSEDMLKYVLGINAGKSALRADFSISPDEIKDLLMCIGTLSQKEDEIMLGFTANKKAGNIVISSKDTINNNFKYTIENAVVEETFKARYDNYFISIMRALRGVSLDSFPCILSNMMFSTTFELGGVKSCYTITVFENK